MQAQYRISEDDYAAAIRLHAWRRFIARPSARQSVGMAAILILLALAVGAHPELAPFLAFIIAVFAIIIALNLFVGAPNKARRQYRQYKGIQGPITVELLGDGIRFSSLDHDSLLRWSNMIRWRQNDSFVLIYQMPILFNIVPKSLVQEGFDIGLLIKRLTDHVGPEC